MNFSLVIPCYNESANLPLLFERCGKLIQAGDGAVEVVIVDNGSTDNSQEILAELTSKYDLCRTVKVEINQGYGFGILSGLRSCTSDIVGWTHADLQTDPVDALKGMQLFKEHGANTFVKGSRYGRPLSDTLFTIGMSIFETVLMKKPLWDINAQPTMFSRSFFESWDSPPNDFALDLYAYFMAKKQGIVTHRYPVKFGERAHGVSHWNVDWTAKKKFIKRTIDFSYELRKRV